MNENDELRAEYFRKLDEALSKLCALAKNDPALFRKLAAEFYDVVRESMKGGAA